MTDRIFALTVVINEDIREDEVQLIIDAMLQLRGVIAVGKNIADQRLFTAENRARREIGDKLIGILFPKQE